ncbi:hypothetical protein TNCV_3000201 [Trichonephila clavipes]|nr:hypothetical protein TNCV_3000201 [Trichonephila clavipes]
MERDRVPPSSEPTPLNSIGGSFSRPQSPFIGAYNRSAPGSLHCNPTSLIRGDSRPARLIPTTKRHLVHHLEAINRIVTFPLRVCFCLDRPTFFFLQVVCSPDVRGELKQLMLFHEASFL